MGLTKRRLYKPELPPARIKGTIGQMAPIALPDASTHEVTMAIYSFGEAIGVTVGRGLEYDQIKDEYLALGKSAKTGLARDFKVSGATIAELILRVRKMSGERRLDRAAINRFIERATL
jgi:hypothetical protein